MSLMQPLRPGQGPENPIGRSLVTAGKLDSAGLSRALRLQQETGERLHILLAKLGLVSDRDIANALSDCAGVPLAKPADFPSAPVLDGRLNARFFKEVCAIPIAERDDAIVIAIADPFDAYTIQAFELSAGKSVLRYVATPAEIEAAFERLYGNGRSAIGEIVGGLGDAEDESANDDVERLKDLASEAPVIRLVNMLISNAVEARASDIHIEPYENKLTVRYRIDGVLRPVEAPPPRLGAALISRVKILAKLNIAERRLPQDGRIKLAIRGNDVDLRISTLPTMHGESLVMRILDRGSVALDFARLGISHDTLQAYLSVLSRPHGILLVTGPTGSGKTTTLYTSLLAISTPEKKIFTVEDPIEYHLDGISQVQIKPQIGLSFAHVLRAMLRQDPDVMMVGEIRDLETAEIAVQASLTGHLVLSTLHTNNAGSTITRLLDMGIDDYLLTSTVTGIVGQRLVRTICPHCREPYIPLPELADQMRLTRFTGGGSVTLYRAKGCMHCSGTGYFGRTGVVEFLVMSEAIQRLVLQRADAQRIQREAIAAGMRTMFDDGVLKALAGTTTLEEVLRVTRDQ